MASGSSTDRRAPADLDTANSTTVLVKWNELMQCGLRAAPLAFRGTEAPERRVLDLEEMEEFASAAFLLFQQGQYGQAREIFERLAAIEPAEAYYWMAIGTVDLADGRLDEAVAHFDAALRLDPCNPIALVNRGEALLLKDFPSEAAADFSRALELSPTETKPMIERARASAGTFRLAGSA